MSDAAAIGHNNPPDAEAIRLDQLKAANGEIVDRFEELAASFQRMPETVEDENHATRFTDMAKIVGACASKSEAARVIAKEPSLAEGRTVDGFFNGMTKPLKDYKKEIERRLNVFNVAKETAERKARQEAERIAREQAAELAKVAAEAEADSLDVAIADSAAIDAAKAVKATEATTADLTRTRGDYGAVSSASKHWVGKITNAGALDLEALRPHIPIAALEQAVRGFVRAGGRELDGATIAEESKTTVR